MFHNAALPVAFVKPGFVRMLKRSFNAVSKAD
jgi:hypothetical protein